MSKVINLLIKMLVSLVNLLQMRRIRCSFKDEDEHHQQQLQGENNLAAAEEAGRPWPWLVPLPLHCIAESVKNQLPVILHRDYVTKKKGHAAESRGVDDEDSNHNHVCIVCLNRMEGGEGVRDLSNCCHAFHKECLDVWIDQGRLTCPLCRSKLLPAAMPASSGITPKDNLLDQYHDQAGEGGRGEGVEVEGDPWRAERMIYLFGKDQFPYM